MTILCIETSTAVCSAAICTDGKPLKQYISLEGGNHAKLLPDYIDQLLAYARQHSIAIDAVALSEGPGSYTGLRIGASTAKGLCYGLNVPLIPVPTLELLCEAARIQLSTIDHQSPVFIPMIDARRMEVYTMIDGETKAVVVENEESLYSGDGEVYYFGDGAEKCAKVFTKPNWHYVPHIVPEARFLALTSDLPLIDCRGTELAYYEPYYLKEFIAAPSHVKGLK